MLLWLLSKLNHFFARNLFERVIVYIFVCELVVKIIFELILGEWYFELSHQQQYIFYGLIILDYIVTSNKVVLFRCKLNYITIFLIGFLFMVMQGVYVGLIKGNREFEIFNDTVPLVVLALNALRMQSDSENSRPVNPEALLNLCSILLVLVCSIGATAVALGKPASSSGGGLLVGVYLPLFFANIIARKTVSWANLAAFVLVIAFSFEDFNRTTMAFGFAASLVYFFVSAPKKPIATFGALIGAVIVVLSAWFFLPETSNTYNRISSLGSINFGERKGSVGERGEEFRSIQSELGFEGPSAVAFGLGHGALYNVKFTHKYIKDYGHAHYSWALFNLRYGLSGYFYVAGLFVVLLYHGWKNWSLANSTALFVSLLCFQSVLYMGTFVNFVILLAGIQFIALKNPALSDGEHVEILGGS